MSLLPAADILVPVDLSDASLGALEQAAELVRSPNGLHLLSVLPELSSMEPGVSWGTVNDSTRIASMEKALRAELSKRDLDAGHVHVVIAPGNPGWVIAREAESMAVDLIVVASHGRTGWKRLALGSVAERVVRLASCPVMVIRRQEDAS